MKNYIIILIIITSFISTSCWKTNNNSWSISTNIESNDNNTKPEITIENKVYKEIANKDWLKDATNEQIDKIIEEDLKIINTPSSNYPFFEQNSNKVADINEIKEKWWMEITRANIYLYWLNKEYKFIEKILTNYGKLYSFSNNWHQIIYSDENIDKIINDIKNNYSNYKMINDDNNIKEITFENNWKNYSTLLLLPQETLRDTVDKILLTGNNIKIEISLLK